MKTGYSFGSLVSFTEALNAAAVKITGDQTIAGVKTFSSNPISSAAQGTGGSHLTRKDYVDGALALKAPLASPALTGTPTAPTAAAGTNTTQLATTAFVAASNTAQLATVAPLMDGTAAVGDDTLVARQDHVHPTDTSRAPLASPTFTGTPAAPTAATGTNTTQLATTAFVAAAIVAIRSDVVPLMNGTAAIGTSTQFTREDHVHPTDTSRAPLASPALTGAPTAPTAAIGTNTTQLATTAFVQRAIGCYVTYATATATASTIDISYIGRLTSTGVAGITYTIPLETSLAGVITGSSFAIRTNSGYGATLAAATGVELYDESGAKVTTYAIPVNTSIEVTRTSTANIWVISSFSGVAATPATGDNSTRVATTAFVAATKTAMLATVAPLMDGTAAVGDDAVAARQDHVHPTDTSRAPLASPALTGTPTAPTAAAGTNTTQVATTAYVTAAIVAVRSDVVPLMNGTAAIGTSTQFTREDHVHPTDTSRAPLASPTFTGTPAAPTAAAGTNTTQLATTAFVTAAITAIRSDAVPLMNGTAAIGTSTQFTREDHVHPTDTSRAPLASPALTGTPTAPTAATGTNTTQLATTAFVTAAIVAARSDVVPLMNGTAAIGASTQFSREDHVHPTDTSRAPLASPTFTGVPAGPTAAQGTKTTQLATTTFVNNEIDAKLAPHELRAFSLPGATPITITLPSGYRTLWIVMSETSSATFATGEIPYVLLNNVAAGYVSLDYGDGGDWGVSWSKSGTSVTLTAGNRGSLCYVAALR